MQVAVVVFRHVDYNIKFVSVRIFSLLSTALHCIVTTRHASDVWRWHMYNIRPADGDMTRRIRKWLVHTYSYFQAAKL